LHHFAVILKGLQALNYARQIGLHFSVYIFLSIFSAPAVKILLWKFRPRSRTKSAGQLNPVKPKNISNPKSWGASTFFGAHWDHEPANFPVFSLSPLEERVGERRPFACCRTEVLGKHGD